MAATTKTNAEKEKKLVTRRLQRDKDSKSLQQQFVSVNFKNYLIKKGVPVEVPVEVAEVLDNADLAEDEAALYAEKIAQREPTNDKI